MTPFGLGLGLGLGNQQKANTAIAPPAAPVASAATLVTDTSFTAHWSDVSGETGYELDVSDDDFATLIGGSTIELGTGVTSYNVEDLDPGTTYYYRVRLS